MIEWIHFLETLFLGNHMLRSSAFPHAPSLTRRFAAPRSSSPAAVTSPMAASARIAIVGDVHDEWCLEEDTKALRFLQPDLVLFTGDFGDENAEIVQSVADLQFPEAVILGNHDAWNTQQFSEKYGVKDMDGSAKRIYNAAMGTPEGHLIIFLAHNGPTGLGSNLNDICGKDWVFGGGDHGDPDLAQAIAHLKETTKFDMPLVVFGHMHKELAYGNGVRKMIVVGTDRSIYLNGAIVPRVKRPIASLGGMSDETPELGGTIRAFTLVEILGGRVDRISEIWVSVIGDETSLQGEHILFTHGNQLS